MTNMLHKSESVDFGIHPCLSHNINRMRSRDGVYQLHLIDWLDVDENHPRWVRSMQCWHCGGVPCDHEEQRKERLVDLKFVRELVSTKKAMEAKLEKIKAQIVEKEMAEQLWKTDRLLLMRQITEKLEAEERWKNEKAKLKEEVEKLKQSNEKLLGQLDIYRRNEGKVEMLTLRIESLQDEVQHLKAENKQLKEGNASQVAEIQKMSKAKAELSEELVAARQESRELRFQVAQLEKELTDLKNDKSKDELIEALRKKLTKLNNEKKEFAQKEKDYEDLIARLRAQIAELQIRVEKSETIRQELEREIERLLKEIEKLKKHIGADRSFKNFVELKRELNFVKDENEDLRHFVRGKQPPTLPVLKAVEHTSTKQRPPSAKSGEKRSSISAKK
ncbi:myosin heavy chain, clone 203 isoform X1 [Lingula anatina]|uniref:Myosin heavy chain, clone 203 isoform X1 n=1 Tax=Lingula anatina TaxID=7574 RepID=A0A1S3HZP5_LINAN|nr:myosin heavy chain, clone 203 isoform X1 [Lingula anatina]|eukprot:XP_013391041.1 myosin heavy chain, clone 203 isoform X1 [Lingula anatina]